MDKELKKLQVIDVVNGRTPREPEVLVALEQNQVVVTAPDGVSVEQVQQKVQELAPVEEYMMGCGGSPGVCDGICPDNQCQGGAILLTAEGATKHLESLAEQGVVKPYIRFRMNELPRVFKESNAIVPIDIQERLKVPGAAIAYVRWQLATKGPRIVL